MPNRDHVTLLLQAADSGLSGALEMIIRALSSVASIFKNKAFVKLLMHGAVIQKGAYGMNIKGTLYLEARVPFSAIVWRTTEMLLDAPSCMWAVWVREVRRLPNQMPRYWSDKGGVKEIERGARSIAFEGHGLGLSQVTCTWSKYR